MDRSTITLLAISFVSGAMLATPARANWPTSPTVNVPVCTEPGVPSTPTELGDGAGGVFIAWPDFRPGPIPTIYSAGVYVQHVLADGGMDPAWPLNGRAFYVAAASQLDPRLIPDGGDGILCAWLDHRNGLSDVYMHHMSRSGVVDPSWPVGGVAVMNTHSATDHVIATDGAGGAFIVWSDDRADPTTDIYAQHVLASGTVDAGWPVDGLPVSTAVGFQQYPKIVSDAAGGAFLSWWDRNTFTVRVRHLLSSGAFDPAWPDTGLSFAGLWGGDYYNVGGELVADGAGGVIVPVVRAGQDLRSEIVAEHVLVSGIADPAWPADGVVVCAAPIYRQHVRLVTDGAGGAFAAWEDLRLGYSNDLVDLYAQHILGSGGVDPAWPVDGIALSTAAGLQQHAAIAIDGAGGVYVVWEEVRGAGFGGNLQDILAEHVLSTGVLDSGWPVDGRPVCLAPNQQASPQLVSDGSGGAIATWFDARPPSTAQGAIYAQSIAITDFVGVEDHPRLAAGIRSITPNPSTGAVDFELATGVSGRASVSVHDVAGRQVAVVADGVFSPGTRHLRWNGEGAHGLVPPGLYFVRFRTRVGEQARGLIRMR